MYSFDSRVRYSEVDSSGQINLQSILDYFQDCSTFHSEDIGLGIDFLAQRNLAWVLSAWQIVVERYPKLGEKIKIATFPYAFKGFSGNRNFYMEDSEKTKIAYANSIWTLMDLRAGKPVRLLPEMIEGYILEEQLEMDYAPRKIPMPDQYMEKEPIVVREHHLDTNNHVNNGQYLRMAMNYVEKGMQIGQMRAEYKKSALLGDILIPLVAKEKNKYTISLCSKEKEVYTIVELS